MSKLLAMFPGQGSQFVGMGKALVGDFPSTKLIFEEVEDACGVSIRNLCFEGPEEELKLTANTQPCILAVSVAKWFVISSETGMVPTAYAGHSLGEYSALVASGKLSLSRAAFLVRKRGEAMQAAVPEGRGSMAAILKYPAAELEELCGRISSTHGCVQVVNYNSKDQLVVAGQTDAVKHLLLCLDELKVRCVTLPVSAPFHSSLMSPAKNSMTPLLDASEIVPNDAQIIANLTGKPVVDYDTSFLVKQIDSPVLWTHTLESALEMGIETYIEVGPGKVLFGLARRTLPRKETVLLNTENLPETLRHLSSLGSA